MRKVLCALALFVGVGLVVASPAPVAPAQPKDKKDDKKDTKAAADVGTIEVYKAKDGWRIRVKNADGKSVAIGTVGHDKKEDALKDVEFLKNTFGKGKVVEIKEEKK